MIVKINICCCFVAPSFFNKIIKSFKWHCQCNTEVNVDAIQSNWLQHLIFAKLCWDIQRLNKVIFVRVFFREKKSYFALFSPSFWWGRSWRVRSRSSRRNSPSRNRNLRNCFGRRRSEKQNGSTRLKNIQNYFSKLKVQPRVYGKGKNDNVQNPI